MDEIDLVLLKELGLTNNEVEVYLKLLMSGSVTVNVLAERTGLHRQACYDALDRLLEKGFVNFVLKDNKKHFQALPPGQLLSYIEEMKNRVYDLLPRLEKIAEAPKETTRVEVYKGKNALRVVLRDVLRTLKASGGMQLSVGIDENKYIEYDKAAIEKYISDMRKFGLRERLLTVKGAKTMFSGPQSEYRFLPKRFFNPNSTLIYGEKVVFLIFAVPLYAIVIESKEIADANRKQFNLLWRIAAK